MQKAAIKSIKKGQSFFAAGGYHQAAEDAHQNFDEKDAPWIVYDIDGNSYFEEDFRTDEPAGLKNRLIELLTEYTHELKYTLDCACSVELVVRVDDRIREIDKLIADFRHYTLAEKTSHRRSISLVWSVEDVQALRPDLGDEQAMEVLQQVESHHDCENGVTWDTLEYWADELFPG